MATLKKKYFWVSIDNNDLIGYDVDDGYDYSLTNCFDSEELAVAAYSDFCDKFGIYEITSLELKIKYIVC